MVRALFDKIIAESAQQRPYYYSIISGYLLEMLVRIVRERLGQPAAAPEEEAPRVATFKGVDVAALMQYIDFNYSRIISLEDLSTLAGVNKTTLISIFKEVYGTTPIRYINRIRLHKAKELLVNTDTSVSEIADLVGFQSIHYFSRFSKRRKTARPWNTACATGRAVISAFSGRAAAACGKAAAAGEKKQKILDNMQSNPGGFVL